MKTLIIHPKDKSTDFLEHIYIDKNFTVIRNNISKSQLRKMILSHDRIIMMGHGTENGLYGFDRFIIDSSFVYLLRKKICMCIWCHANKFVEKYGLCGFYTGMIISEYTEALIYSQYSFNDNQIDYSNYAFANTLKEELDNLHNIENVITKYESYNVLTGLQNPIIDYNKDRLFFRNELLC